MLSPPAGSTRMKEKRVDRPLLTALALKVAAGIFDVSDVPLPLAQSMAMPMLERSSLFSEVFGRVLGGLGSRPWLVGLLVLIALARVVRRVRAIIHGRHQQDRLHRFSGQQRMGIFARAGHRCEQYSWLTGRCRATEDLQADHVHPHSRGGATSLDNGQALCRRHNKRKAARVPCNWELDRLARHRLTYFPACASGEVVRHGTPEPGGQLPASSDLRVRPGVAAPRFLARRGGGS